MTNLKRKSIYIVISVLIAALMLGFALQMVFANSAMQAEALALTDISSYFGGGDGSEANPYLITNEAELGHINDTIIFEDDFYYVDCCFKLVNDIFITKSNWTPVEGYFRGKFDGNHKTIYNMKINAATNRNYGFFESLEVGTVENLNFENAIITNNTNSDVIVNMGIIAGTNNGHIINCNVKRSKITAQYAYNAGIGGICGYTYCGEVTDCESSVDIIGAGQVGGITGFSFSGNIIHCQNNGTISYMYNVQNGCAGGIVGEAKQFSYISDNMNYGVIKYGSPASNNKKIQPCMAQIVGLLGDSTASNNIYCGSTDYTNLKKLFLSTNQKLYCSVGEIGRSI